MFNIPIVLIFFNRPDKLKMTFDKVKAIKPKQLFLVQDGPRNDLDLDKIQKCRDIVENIDWDCEVHKNYSTVNLGCGQRPSTGISWAFSKVNKLIILEDDCVVSNSFFSFCEKMLNKYEKNDKIMLISGMNLLEKTSEKDSYFFSQACTIGAWATWKRVWDRYDFTIEAFERIEIKKTLRENIKYRNVLEQKFWAWNLTREKIRHGEKIDWWDYQLHFLLYLNNGLGIVPTKNLVENIGYGDDATNVSKKEEGLHFNLKSYELGEIVHPKKIECNDSYDQKVYELQNIKINHLKVFLSKIKRKVLRLRRR